MDSLASTVAPATGRITVRITVVALDAPETDVVLSAAFQLFGPQDAVDVVLVLAGVDELTEEHGAAVQDRCLLLAPDPALLPEILLLGVTEAADLVAQADVTTGRDAAESARAVVLLTATAQAIWDDEPSPTVPAQAAAPSGPKVWPQVTRLQEELTVARRDVRSGRAIATGTRRPTVVLVFQHRSYWGAVATLCTELAARPEVDVEVVALDSTADGRTESTAAFLADRGIEARTAEWFLERMDDVDVVVLDNPYDEFRPVGLQVPQLVDAGIRVVSVPYGANAMGGEVMDRMLWDLPLQRSAWRAYVGSPTQESLFARHCASGAAHVRVLGTPKLDRLQQPASSDAARRWRTLADGRPVVLWNPHFRVEQGGWSTFDSYVGPLLERFTDDDRALLVVRPHFRLFADLRRLGAEGVKLERDVRSIVARSRNIVLDESPDYLDALLACDVMLSDMSSLVTELLPTGKPILYLRRADGPGLNEEGAHFAALEHADSWVDVAGFLDRVLDGEDRAAEARAEVVRENFPLADGRAGERIAGDIVTGLLEELGERTPVLGRALSPAFLQSHYDGARSDRLDHAVLLSAYGGSVACSPRAIARELHRRGHDAQRWWVVRDPRQAVPEGCQPVLKDSAAHLELLSRSRWVVDNEAMAWFLDKRPGQTFLQTWHGTPLKLLRWHLHEAVPRSLEYMKWADKEAGQWDVLVSASPLFSEIAADAFHTPARVLDTGYPRNDVLADPARRDATAAAVRRALSIPAGAKVVLHAPTYRDQVPGVAASSWVTPRVTDAAALAESLGPDTVVLQRVHRFTADLTRTSHPQVREVSDYPDSADLMALADLLVTDYSSSMFDFTATGRPIVLHVPDYEHYRDSLRGFYFPLDQVAPGPLTRTHEELAVAVKERLAPGAAPDAGYTAFRERFAPWDDGHAAERVVDAVFA